jgi:endonuclease/exonuclease/phosphatase family metal-dependent hydrolase
VLTLNIAHGRQLSAHQLFLPRERIRRNLDAISDYLTSAPADLIALQEVDSASAWNGNFNHLDYLATRTKCRCAVHGEHMRRLKLAYGTAILSQLLLSDPQSVSLRSSSVMPPKGFVVASFTWPGEPTCLVDVVSLHLDFASTRVRFRQINVLISELRKRGRPTLVMGDFNSTWDDTHSAVRRLVDQLDLQAYDPGSRGHGTFRYRDKRWDWILISRNLRFVDHDTVAEKLSDHFIVRATIAREER